MAVHPSGDGAAWVENVDVDQPHGLDFRFTDHVAKGVRKRIEHQHTAFADATVGGVHVPGNCSVLLQGDGTADISGAVDLTLAAGSGIGWSKTGWLFCFTANNVDPTTIRLDPHSICYASDMTWTGQYQFDASVIFCNPVEITSGIVDGSWQINGATDISGGVLLDGSITVLDAADFSNARFLGDVSVTGGMAIDGTTNMRGEMDISAVGFNGPTDMLGTCVTTNSAAASLALNEVYLAQTDGFLFALTGSGNSHSITGALGDTTDPVSTRAYATNQSGAVNEPLAWNMPVPKGQYVKVTKAGAVDLSTLKWTPWGVGGLLLI